ncbi:MAG: Rrf2 family transcriptional regulator [Deltaproteobacteria bacterium]|nr:Rrf2 family transcriptional regulator [Candidatus Zymogenaceae bacterium]
MRLSTRVRYGVRLMLSLAENWGKGPMMLSDIARRQEISEKYLSLIVIPLRTKGLINSTRGAHGGYELSSPPEQITVEQILEAIEGRPSLVDCIDNGTRCPRAGQCVTRDIWSALGDTITQALDSVSLDQLIEMKRNKSEKAVTYAI